MTVLWSRLKELFSAVLPCAVLALAFLAYHQFTVAGLKGQLATARMEARDIRDAFELYKYRQIGQTAELMQRHLNSVETATIAREDTRDAIQDAGKKAQKNIVAAESSGDTGSGGVLFLDTPLPARIANELVCLHAQAAAAGNGTGSARPASPGGVVPGKAVAGPACRLDAQE